MAVKRRKSREILSRKLRGKCKVSRRDCVFKGKGLDRKGGISLGRHDQLFKDLLRAFFGDLLNLVMPEVATYLNLGQVEFLDKETFTDLPVGRRRELDLVAKVPIRKGARDREVERLVLIHIEIERRYRSVVARRLWRYTMHLSLRHKLPVVPIVVFLRGGPVGVEHRKHREEILGLEVVRFQFHALGLSRPAAEDWLERPEPLAAGLAALMRPTSLSRVEHKLACLRRLAKADLNEARRFLLVNTVETYLQLEGEELIRYTSLIENDPDPEVRAMEMTWADKIEAKGEAKGREAGFLAGTREVILRQLEERFGQLTPSIERRLAMIDSPEDLHALGTRLLKAESLEDLGLPRPS